LTRAGAAASDVTGLDIRPSPWTTVVGSVADPATDAGGHQVYARHGSHVWVWDVLLVLVAGGAVALALWVSPVGLRRRRAASPA
jgi:hypothetical protein